MFRYIGVTYLALVITFAAQAYGQEEKDDRQSKWSSAFESDSEFMKGFETGIFIRTKGTSPSDYGCTIEDDSEDSISAAIVVIRTAIANAKSSLPDDQIV